jgi:hypothetical protein
LEYDKKQRREIYNKRLGYVSQIAGMESAFISNVVHFFLLLFDSSH